MKTNSARVCGIVVIYVVIFILENSFVCTILDFERFMPHTARAASPYSGWEKGPSADSTFFPIGVWLQAPSRASQYKSLGINYYFGLWQGPTEAQLAELRIHGMRVICDQNSVGLAHKNDSLIMGWMHGDEPDNLQWNAATQTYDPPIPPQDIIDDYNEIVRNDALRPVFLNLGQKVANDAFFGSTSTSEDYKEYVKGADIVSFDVYPVVGINKTDGENYLYYVPRGVDRLRVWSNYEKPVWNFIECTHISNPDKKATPTQVKAEVWMSLIHGSSGICYFVHQFEPGFIEAALLVDAEMVAAVTEINNQIHRLAVVLNSPSVEDGATAQSSVSNIPIDVMVKHHGGSTYLFAVPMKQGAVTGTIEFARFTGSGTIEVIDENRTVNVENGSFEDSFDSYEVHLYKLNDIVTGVNENGWHENTVTSYYLAQNYPNPFNARTVIHYKVLSSSYIDISIYDIQGKRITSLVSSPHGAGEYSITWDGTNSEGADVSSGIYFYTINAGSFFETKKLVLLK